MSQPTQLDGETIIRIIARVDGARTRVDGQYLVEYDPTLKNGTYTLETSPDKAKAKRFARFEDAVTAYRAVCPNHRYDSPGHLNRPLTAHTVSFERA